MANFSEGFSFLKFANYLNKMTKCHFITKPELIPSAREKFRDLDVEIIDGFRVLGSIIGSDDSCKKFLDQKKSEHCDILKKLDHSKISPQNVYKCLTSAVQQKLTFLSRTTPNSELVLNESEQLIADSLLPNLIGNGVDTRKYREVFSLPVRDVA